MTSGHFLESKVRRPFETAAPPFITNPLPRKRGCVLSTSVVGASPTSRKPKKYRSETLRLVEIWVIAGNRQTIRGWSLTNQ